MNPRLHFLEDFVRGENLGGTALDVGGTKTVQEIFQRNFEFSSYILLNLDRGDLLGTGENIPLKDESVDCVVLTEVLEHVREPDLVLREIRRVLRRGGKLVLSAPFTFWHHPDPIDFYRFSSQGLRYVLEKNGFEVRRERRVCRLCCLTIYLLQSGFEYLMRGVRRMLKVRRRITLDPLFTFLYRVSFRFEGVDKKFIQSLYMTTLVLAVKPE